MGILRWASELFFSDILIHLDISPSFPSIINRRNFKLGSFALREVDTSEHTGCMVDQSLEGLGSCGERKERGDGEIGCCLVKDDRYGEESQ